MLKPSMSGQYLNKRLSLELKIWKNIWNMNEGGRNKYTVHLFIYTKQASEWLTSRFELLSRTDGKVVTNLVLPTQFIIKCTSPGKKRFLRKKLQTAIDLSFGQPFNTPLLPPNCSLERARNPCQFRIFLPFIWNVRIVTITICTLSPTQHLRFLEFWGSFLLLPPSRL